MGSNQIEIRLNGAAHALPSGQTVATFIRGLRLSGQPVAVEVNGQIVPSAALGEHVLQDGDELEIVTLVGGG